MFKDFKVVSEGCNIPNKPEYKEVRAAISTTLQPQRASFKLSGVNTQFANLIRSTLLTGLPVRHLFANYENLKTTDEYIIPEVILNRIRIIPILQDTQIGKNLHWTSDVMHRVILKPANLSRRFHRMILRCFI
jgi:hypothetical protein